MLSTITYHYQLSIINYQWSIINYQLSPITYQLSIINDQLSTINYQLSTTCRKHWDDSNTNYQLGKIGWSLKNGMSPSVTYVSFEIELWPHRPPKPQFCWQVPMMVIPHWMELNQIHRFFAGNSQRFINESSALARLMSHAGNLLVLLWTLQSHCSALIMRGWKVLPHLLHQLKKNIKCWHFTIQMVHELQ